MAVIAPWVPGSHFLAGAGLNATDASLYTTGLSTGLSMGHELSPSLHKQPPPTPVLPAAHWQAALTGEGLRLTAPRPAGGQTQEA